MASETPFYQKVILWSALAATIVAAEVPLEEVVQPAVRSSGDQRQRDRFEQVHEILPVDRLGKRQFSATADDIFAIVSWEPKRTTVSVDAEERASRARQEEIRWQPPPPVAPPLQFEYLGRVISQGRVRVFLARGDENYAVGVGERIHAEYRVERIREGAVEGWNEYRKKNLLARTVPADSWLCKSNYA